MDINKTTMFSEIVTVTNNIIPVTGNIVNSTLTTPITMHRQTSSFNGTLNFIPTDDLQQILIYYQTTSLPYLALSNIRQSINTNTLYIFSWDGKRWYS